MTRQQWRDYKDFDMLSREMNGDFSFGQMKMRAEQGSYLLPKAAALGVTKSRTPNDNIN